MTKPRYHHRSWERRRKQLPCSYGEHRTKVTLRDFRAQRFMFAQGWTEARPWERNKHELDWAYLMSSPADAERLQSRDQCRLSAKTLETRCRKYLTLGSEYAARETFRRKRADDAKPFRFPIGWGDTAEAKRYHMRRVAEYRLAQLTAEPMREAA